MTPREFARDVLYQVLYQGGYAGLLLRNRKFRMSEDDAALVSELVYGTLRNFRLLEYQWKDLARGHVRPKTAALLAVSVYQLLFLDRIPAYAVIHEAVELAEVRDKKFVNAVLRQIDERGSRLPEFTDELEKLAFETNHPVWLLRLWSAQYGPETARKIAEHDQGRGVVYGRINPLKINPEEVFFDPRVKRVENLCFTYDGLLSRTAWFQNGQVIIQDRSSQLLPAMLNAEPGMRVLDVCAAPGTKTQQIAAMMKNRGEIIANDIYEHRLALVSELMKRTGVTICRTSFHDATEENKEWARQSFDRILIDVPCSGLGDLRHKSEIRFHISPEQLDELTALQGRILRVNSRYLKPGGILVYSTCTLNKKENEGQIRKFLLEHPEFRLLSEKTYFPYEMNSDGFYVAQLQVQETVGVIK